MCFWFLFIMNLVYWLKNIHLSTFILFVNVKILFSILIYFLLNKIILNLFQNDSSAHLFSSMIWASSSGEKSFSMLKNFLVSTIVIPLIIEATLAHESSRSDLISMKLAARMSSKRTSWSSWTKLAYHSLTTSDRLFDLNGLSISGG